MSFSNARTRIDKMDGGGDESARIDPHNIDIRALRHFSESGRKAVRAAYGVDDDRPLVIDWTPEHPEPCVYVRKVTPPERDRPAVRDADLNDADSWRLRWLCYREKLATATEGISPDPFALDTHDVRAGVGRGNEMEDLPFFASLVRWMHAVPEIDLSEPEPDRTPEAVIPSPPDPPGESWLDAVRAVRNGYDLDSHTDRARWAAFGIVETAAARADATTDFLD
jgi:hypothetical protein